MGSESRNLRLRATRSDEPDSDKLIEWVLNIAETRHRAWIDSEPDPYGLPPPDDLVASSPALRFSGVRERIEIKHHSGKEAHHDHPNPRH